MFVVVFQYLLIDVDVDGRILFAGTELGTRRRDFQQNMQHFVGDGVKLSSAVFKTGWHRPLMFSHLMISATIGARMIGKVPFHHHHHHHHHNNNNNNSNRDLSETSWVQHWLGRK